MYSEAKLAFIIYLWYPKTMVMVTFFYQKSLKWMFSVCGIESTTASSFFFLFLFFLNLVYCVPGNHVRVSHVLETFRDQTRNRH